MDASFGLGKSKQTDEKQQEGERARRRTRDSSVPAGLGLAAEGRAFLRNDSDSFCPSCGQRRAVTSHVASVKQRS